MLAPLASAPSSPAGTSRQAEGLRRWLTTQPAPQVAPAQQKVVTLRQALVEEGLAILPDPLHDYPCMKVVRVDRLLRETAFLA